jgi:nitroimidazol reductase NimA-like FMN-containing flavoprotein (pyridoxamine 5'-phosphate oxidase superfamily)
MDNLKSREDLLKFLRDHFVATLATIKDGISPTGTTVYYYTDDEFNFYFLTKDDTEKFKNIQRNPRVALVVTNSEALQTVQVEGEAEVADFGEEKYSKILDDFVMSLKSRGKEWENLPINHIYKGYFSLIKIKPNWLRWTDYKNWEHSLQFESKF